MIIIIHTLENLARFKTSFSIAWRSELEEEEDDDDEFFDSSEEFELDVEVDVNVASSEEILVPDLPEPELLVLVSLSATTADDESCIFDAVFVFLWFLVSNSW